MHYIRFRPTRCVRTITPGLLRLDSSDMFQFSSVPSLSYLLSLVGSIAAALRYSHTQSGPESGYIRDYFMAGGSYTDDGFGEGMHAFQGQMYVERFTPLSGVNRPIPLVLIHGTAQTGTVRLIDCAIG